MAIIMAGNLSQSSDKTAQGLLIGASVYMSSQLQLRRNTARHKHTCTW
jgi:hypothetical protein